MSQGHASDEILELYSLGRLREPELAAFEEHLLVCPQCQRRVEHEDEITRITRRALETVATQRRSAASLPWWRRPKIAWTSGFAVAAAALILMMMLRPAVENVHLIARRGAGTSAVQVHNGAPLNLTIDATELPLRAAYDVEVVDANGRVVANSSAKQDAGHLKAGVPGLHAGTYWVRVYGGGTQELLREFSLAVR